MMIPEEFQAGDDVVELEVFENERYGMFKGHPAPTSVLLTPIQIDGLCVTSTPIPGVILPPHPWLCRLGIQLHVRGQGNIQRPEGKPVLERIPRCAAPDRVPLGRGLEGRDSRGLLLL